MKNKTLALMVLLLILAPSVLAQAYVTERSLNFNSDTVGTTEPTNDFFTTDASGGGGTRNANFGVSSTTISTGNSYELDYISGGSFYNIFFQLKPAFYDDYDQASYYWSLADTTTGDHLTRVGLATNAGTTAVMQFISSGTGEVDVQSPTATHTNCKTPIQITHTFDWDAVTYDYVITGSDSATCGTGSSIALPGGATVLTQVIHAGDSGTTNGGPWYMDDITFSLINIDAPTGVRATVTNNQVTPDEYQVKFSLSPDDTDQETGDFQYELYYDTGGGPTLWDTYPAGSALDGIIGDQPAVATTGSISWWAVAIEPIASIESPNSCTVTLDSTILGDTESCGETIPGEEVTGSDLTGPQGGLFGGDKTALAQALQVSESALEILIGVLLLLLLIAGGWFTYGMVGAAGLGLIGLVMNYALGLFPFWTLYVMAFIGIAVGILLLKIRGVASG